MKIVNLTPHDVVVRTNAGDLVFPASGAMARVTSSQIADGDIDGIPVMKTVFGEVEGLPDPQPDTVFIVSGIVMTALKGSRSDVVQPDTSPAGAVRDDSGRIIAVRGFQRV